MKSCDEILELISAELDGELSGQEQACLNAHLNNCEACRELREQMRQLSAVLREDAVRAPKGFVDMVMARLATEPAQLPASAAEVECMALRAKRRSVWRKWTASAAVVAVVVLGAVALPGRGMDAAETGTMKTEAVVDAGPIQYAADMDGGAVWEDATAADRSMMTAASTAKSDAAFCVDTVGALPEAAPEASVEGDGQRYCGVLTFGQEEMPDGLEEYPCVSSHGGVLEYEVPAAYYLELAAAQPLCDDTADLKLYGDCIDEQAPTGLVRILAPEG